MINTHCTECELSLTRSNIVWGEGDCSNGIMIIGEAPGKDENITGRPFVGTAGKTLRKLIVASGLEIEKCRISNVVKCQPPKNRRPTSYEVKTCGRNLQYEIHKFKPAIIVTIGHTAAKSLLDTKASMSELICKSDLQYNDIPVICVYHTSPLCINRTSGAKDQILAGLIRAKQTYEWKRGVKNDCRQA